MPAQPEATEAPEASQSLAATIGSNILNKAKRANLVPAFIVQNLASIGCSNQEISTLTKIPLSELPKDLIAAGKAKLNHAIRRAQIKHALKGNPALLIWLGKANLGQRDQPEPPSQHTNIVVTSDLLANLQRSYQSTLSDIRRTKLVECPQHLDPSNPQFPSNPDKQPALAYVPRGTVSSEPSVEASVSQSISHNTDTLSNSLSNNASESNTAFETLSDPAPPGGPTPTITPTPTPKRLTSLGLGKSKIGKKSKVTKWASYAVGATAERWSDSLKKLKVARGGSRKEEEASAT